MILFIGSQFPIPQPPSLLPFHTPLATNDSPPFQLKSYDFVQTYSDLAPLLPSGINND